MKKIFKLALFLGLVSLIAASALTFVNSKTKPIINANQIEKTNNLLKDIAPNATDFEKVVLDLKNIDKVYIAKNNDDIVMYIYEISYYGFQSEVDVLVGITPDGNFSKFSVVNQAETPGYGTQITTNEGFIAQFNNKSIEEPINTISGATVTTRPIKNAVNQAVDHFNQNYKKEE